MILSVSFGLGPTSDMFQGRSSFLLLAKASATGKWAGSECWM